MAVPTLAPVDLAPSTPTSSPVDPVASPAGQAVTPAPGTQVATPVPATPVANPAPASPVATPAPATPVVTQATLRADYDRLVAEVRANFTKEKQLLRIAKNEQRTALDLDNKIQKLNETAQLQASYVTNLSPEYQAIFKQLQAKEMETLLKQQTQNKVKSAVQSIKLNSVNQLAEF